MRRRFAPFTVSDLARAVGVHPNTVRLYEAWGLLPPVPRRENGWRKYSAAHLEQMRLARMALPGPFPGGGEPVYALVKEAARGNLSRAIELSAVYSANVELEYDRSQKAYRELIAWARRRASGREDAAVPLLHRREAARRLGATVDALRTWERNALLHVGKDENGYCLYGAEALYRSAIVRSLRIAGYSISAIHRVFRECDRRNVRGLRRALDSPAPGADLVSVADRWLTTLKEHRRRARRIRAQLERMRLSQCGRGD